MSLSDSLAFRVGGDISPLVAGLKEAGNAGRQSGEATAKGWNDANRAMDATRKQAESTKGVYDAFTNTWKKTTTAVAANSSAVKESTGTHHAFAQVQRNLAYQVSDVVQSIQAGQSPWRALSIQVSDVGFQLGSAAIATGKMAEWTSRLAALAAPGGVLTVALLAAGGAYMYLRSEINLAEEAMAKQAERATEMAGLHREVERAALRAAVAEGRMTEAEAAQITATEQAADAFEGYRTSLKGRIKETEELLRIEQKEMEAASSGLRGGQLAAGEWSTATRVASAEVTRLESALSMMQNQMSLINVAEERHAKNLATSATAGKERANSERERAKALKETERALKKQQATDTAARDDLLRGMKQQEDAHTSLAEIRNTAASEMLGREEQIRLQLDEQLASIWALGEASGDLALAEEAAAAVRMQAMADIAEIRDIDAEKEKARADDRINDARRLAEANLGAASSFFGGIGALAEAAANAQTDAQGRAAVKLLRFAQAAGIAEATINAYVAASKAWAQGGIFGAIGAAGALAGGIAQVTAIASQEIPTYHDTPGAVYMREGGPILAAPGDTVIAGRSTEDVRRQADQMPGGGGSGLRVVAVPEYQHWDRFGRDAMRAPGTWTEIKRQTARTPGRR